MRLSRNRRLLSVLVAATLLGAATVGAAAPASAAPAQATGHATAHATASFTLDYVAFGDSYAAGQGALPKTEPCNRTRLSYPSLLDLAPNVRLTMNVTCAGATTGDVLAKQLPAAATALASAKLVTLTAGANDVNPVQIAQVCGAFPPPSAECTAAVAQATAAASGVYGNLLTIMQRIAQAAPGALIVVTGYPLLFEPLPPDNGSAGTVAAVNAGIDALNGAIFLAVHDAGVSVNVRFADVKPIFAGHGIGSRFPWIWATGPDAYHPNAFGHAAYAVAVGKLAATR